MNQDQQLYNNDNAIFVANLDFKLKDEELKTAFQRFGTIKECKIKLNSKGSSSGYGYIKYSTEESANNAILNMDNTILKNKKIRVSKEIIYNIKGSFLGLSNQKSKEYGEKDYIEIADPSNDQIFKNLFTLENEVNGITGSERLISILNSIIYPKAGPNGFKIQKIKPLTNETNKLIQDSLEGSLRFDVICECYSHGESKEDKKIINLEVQISNQKSFVQRIMANYTKFAINSPNKNIIIISLLYFNYNFPNMELYNKDEFGNPIEPADESGVRIIFINMLDMVNKLSTNDPIYIDGNEIQFAGREWLKLLSVRFWGYKINNKYLIPNNLTFSDQAIKSAVEILKSISQNDLQILIHNQSVAKGALDFAKEGIKEKYILKMAAKNVNKEYILDFFDITDDEFDRILKK